MMRTLRRFWERRATIRARISLAMLIEALLVLPVVAMSIFYLNDMLGAVQQMVTREALASRLAEKIAEDIRDVQRSERVYLAMGDPRALTRGQEGLERIRKNLKALQELGEDAEGRYAKIEQRTEDYAAIIQLLVGRMPGEGRNIRWPELQRQVGTLQAQQVRLREMDVDLRQAARDSLLTALGSALMEVDLNGLLETAALMRDPEVQRFLQNMAEYGDEINLLAEEMAEQHWQMLVDLRDRAVRLSEQAKRNILTVLMVTLILSLYFVFVFPRRVVAPIRRISNVIQQAERGFFDSPAPLQSRDEIGEVSRLFHRFIAQVRTFEGLKTRHILIAHQKLLALGAMVAEGVIVLEAALRVEYINRSARNLLGWSREEAPGDLREMEGTDEIVRAVSDCAAGREDTVDITVTAAGEGDRPGLRCRLSRILDSRGGLGAVVIVLTPQG